MNPEEWQNLQNFYTATYKDILESKNLDMHLASIEETIKNLELSIDSEKAAGKATPALDNIKNDFYFLKYEILERT
jgi:UDP-N-acetylglucosamine pyrophosphorylase